MTAMINCLNAKLLEALEDLLSIPEISDAFPEDLSPESLATITRSRQARDDAFLELNGCAPTADTSGDT